MIRIAGLTQSVLLAMSELFDIPEEDINYLDVMELYDVELDHNYFSINTSIEGIEIIEIESGAQIFLYYENFATLLLF